MSCVLPGNKLLGLLVEVQGPLYFALRLDHIQAFLFLGMLVATLLEGAARQYTLPVHRQCTLFCPLSQD